MKGLVASEDRGFEEGHEGVFGDTHVEFEIEAGYDPFGHFYETLFEG